jgi:hypothetical protein
VQINPNAKTYMVTPFPETSTTTTRPTSTGKPGEVTKGGVVTSTITVKDTGERKQMFGYTARHLIITIETASSPDACNKTNMKMQQDGWYIDAEFAITDPAAAKTPTRSRTSGPASEAIRFTRK